MTAFAPQVGFDTRGYVVIATGSQEHIAMVVAKRERASKLGPVQEVQVSRWNHNGRKWKPIAWIVFARVLRLATPEDMRTFKVPR